MKRSPAWCSVAAFRCLAQLVLPILILVPLLAGCTNDPAPIPGYYPTYGVVTGTGTTTGTTGVQPAAAAGTTGAFSTTGQGVTGTTGATSTTGQIQCQPGLQLCGTECLDVLASPANCGGCGVACPEGRLCAGGACSNECSLPYTQCNGVCVLLTSDSANCGACDNACDLGQPCVGGVCGCPNGTLFCGGQCVDPLSNAAHCGACDMPCPIGGNCADGVCQCPVGTTLCGNECVSLATAQHCGTCENVCAVGQICDLGVCIPETQACTPPGVRCGTGCVDIQSAPGHCGACDQPCQASESCQAGLCGCPLGQTQCAGGCFNTQQNPLHCGSCDTPCTNGQSCQAGVCSCADSAATLCGNACVLLQTDTANCGACGTICPAGLPCTDGVCSCPDGQVLCDGQCVDTESEPTHCGACGSACPEGESCIVGICSGSVGDSCTSTLAHGISVTELAVYQAGKISIMQEGSAIASGERDVAVVAGKNAIVRVFVELEDGWANRIVSARLSLIDGETVEQLFHKKTVDTASSESSLGTTFNIEVDGDLITSTTRYALEIVECDATTGTVFSPRFPAAGDEALEARDVGVLKIHYIPTVTNGTEAAADTALLDAYSEYMELMYPVSAVEYTVASTVQSITPVSANGNGWSEILAQLRSQRMSENPDDDVYYYGLIEPPRSYCQGGCVAGVGYTPGADPREADGRVSIGLSYGDEGSAETMAHEVGHNHGRPHAPCGGVSGAEPWPHQGTNQNGAPLGWWGFRFPDQLIASEQSTDIMGYCPDKWVSDYNYNNFMERIERVNANLAVINMNPIDTWDVIVVSMFGMSWGVPPTGPVEAQGTPEAASILDAAGSEIAQVTVYRMLMDHLNGSTLMVPTAQPGWHAIKLKGELPLVYGGQHTSVP